MCVCIENTLIYKGLVLPRVAATGAMKLDSGMIRMGFPPVPHIVLCSFLNVKVANLLSIVRNELLTM